MVFYLKNMGKRKSLSNQMEGEVRYTNDTNTKQNEYRKVEKIQMKGTFNLEGHWSSRSAIFLSNCCPTVDFYICKIAFEKRVLATIRSKK